MHDAGEALPASLLDEFNRQAAVPFALREGYKREGDQYVFQEPERQETPAARAAREQEEAMAQLRAAKAAEAPAAADRTGLDLQPTERPESGTPMEQGERAPDILDWIADHFRSGVKFDNAQDYGDYLDRARGAAAQLMALTKGEPADQVLKAMHEGGEYHRLQTADDLAEAMVRAGASRAAAPAARRQAKAAVQTAAAAAEAPATVSEEIDPWQHTIDFLNGLKMDTSGQLHAFGLLPAAWNGLIDLVKTGVRGGKAVADAVDWAIGEFKARFPGTAFDEAGARAHLNEAGLRETGQKILASPAVSPTVKDTINEYLYQRRSNATDEDTAQAIVRDLGVDKAREMLLQPPASLPGAVRSKLLGAVTRTLAEQERQARIAGRTDEAAGLASQQGKLWDAMLPQITDLAQSLQAMRDIISMSPDGHVARVRSMLERKAQEELDARGSQVEQVKQALQQGQAQGIEDLKRDATANEAAKAAVNGHVENSQETHRAVIMDLAGPWSESPEIVRQARELVRAKANELLNREPLGPKPSERLRAIMDDLGKRAAGIAANYFQGIATHAKGLTGLLQERLGLDQAHASSLAKTLEKEFDKQVTIAKNRLPQRIASARVAAERRTGAQLESTQGQTDAALRRQLRDLNLKLGDVVKQEAGRQEATGEHVAERIVTQSGLQGDKADTLRTVLKNRWDTLVTDAQRRTLEAMQKASGTPVTRPFKNAFDKLVELNRLGALTSERFFDVVKQSLKLRELTEPQAKELRGMVEKAQRMPEGFLRERAAAELLQHTEKLSGNQRWYDVPMGIFYANVLSGFTTPAKILFENTNLLIGNTVAELLGHPGRNLMHPLDFAKSLATAYGRGITKGALQAESTLRTGVVTGVWAHGRSSVLEGKPFGPKLEPLNFWKYFTRVIGTAHETTFKPAWEVKQTMLARDVAQREGLRGQELQRRVADLMANTDLAVGKARAQATAELSELGRLSPRQAGESGVAYAKRAAGDKMDLARRTREIIEQQREQNMPGSTERARDFALRTAYLNEPYGFLGKVATEFRSLLERSRKDFPLAGTLAKTQVPFTTVVANILNEKLNWTPWGLVRAADSMRTGKLYGREMLPGERQELMAKAVVGTIAAGALATLFGDHLHGNGPSSPEKRKQMQAAGWIPHSIEYNGRYYSYMNTPLALPLAVIGNLKDWSRYGKGDDADGVSRLTFALKATANAIVSQGMLDSVKRLFEALGDESTSEGADKLEKLTARTGAAFIVPNLLQQVDRLYDPTVYDQSGIGALVNSQIPLARRSNKPALNVLGEPVQSGPFHYWTSEQSADPVWRLLADKQAFVPEPSKATIVGMKALGAPYARAITPDEYYDLVAESGPQIRKDIEQMLPQLQAMKPEQAQVVVRDIANLRHQAAKAKLAP